MKVSFEPAGYTNKREMEAIIRAVLETHPIGPGGLTPDLEKLDIRVVLDANELTRDPEVDCTHFPIVTLHFGVNRYESAGGGAFDRAQFKKHMYHEFAHLVDRCDQSFGITAQKEETAKA